jgi:ubiquinone/menaquinone biosynthesis C-methylase UbiE
MTFVNERVHAAVAADFDRYARLIDPADDDDLYQPFLLGLVPPVIDRALDLGCGTGTFTRALALRASRVTGLDFSAEMLRLAAQRSPELTNIEWAHADADSFALEPDTYDAIVSIKTLHHLRADDIIPRLARAIRPGGLLLLHDVLESDGGVAGALRDALASVVCAVRLLVRSGRVRQRRELREFWSAHARLNLHPNLATVRRLAASQLPGSTVRRHLLWRYTIVWRKPP